MAASRTVAPVASLPEPMISCSALACASPNVAPPSVEISTVAVPTTPGVATRITMSAFFCGTPETVISGAEPLPPCTTGAEK